MLKNLNRKNRCTSVSSENTEGEGGVNSLSEVDPEISGRNSIDPEAGIDPDENGDSSQLGFGKDMSDDSCEADVADIFAKDADTANAEQFHLEPKLTNGSVTSYVNGGGPPKDDIGGLDNQGYSGD